MFRTALRLTAAIFILAFVAGCTKDPQYIQTIAPSSNTALISIDTFSTAYTVAKLDSFVTSSTGLLIAGHVEDPETGKTTVTPEFRFVLPAGDNPIINNNNLAYDSLVLIVHPSKNYYGDTSSTFSVSIHRLSQDLSTETNAFYNTTDFAADAASIGDANFKVRPNANDSLRIRMSDALGSEIYNLYRTNGSAITSAANFQLYFKGLKLVTDKSGTNVIYGFAGADSSTIMRLYYHADVGIRQTRTIDFKMDAAPFQFNHINNNSNGTPLQALAAGKEISSHLLGNKFFIAPFQGLRTYITLPSIKDLQKIDGYVKVLGAQLVIRPVRGSYQSYPLFPVLNLYTQAQDLSITGPLQNAAANSTQNGNLTIDKLYGDGTSYSFDISKYISTEQTTNIYTSVRLFLSPATPASPITGNSFGRFAGVDGSDVKYRSFLTIQVLTFKK